MAPEIEGGYLLLARKIITSDIMNKPPHYLKLWIWMLGKAFYADGDKLQRGQLFTTISEMQDACGYKVGARRERPTKDQIRNCYEHLANTTMITTAKTTRGLLITICNYEYYQNPNNYEGHSENATKTLRKPSEPHTIDKEDNKKKKEEESFLDLKPEIEKAEDSYLTKKKRNLSGKRLETFNRFWNAFDYKSGRAEAADAWLDIPELTNATVEKIVEAAKREAERRPRLKAEGKTPKMAQGWLSGRRWEDEAYQPQSPKPQRLEVVL